MTKQKRASALLKWVGGQTRSARRHAELGVNTTKYPTDDRQRASTECQTVPDDVLRTHRCITSSRINDSKQPRGSTLLAAPQYIYLQTDRTRVAASARPLRCRVVTISGVPLRKLRLAAGSSDSPSNRRKCWPPECYNSSSCLGRGGPTTAGFKGGDHGKYRLHGEVDIFFEA